MKWLVCLPFNLFFVLMSFILSPALAALSVVMGRDTLPGVLQWFSTMDDTLDGGQHQVGYKTGVKGAALWWQRTCWICRNPAHGFGTRVLGFPTAGHTVKNERSEGNPNWDKGYSLYSADLYDASGNKYWTVRANIPLWGSWYIKFWAGWNWKAYDGKYHQYEIQCGPRKF